MANSSKQKGTRHETSIVRQLAHAGFPARRTPAGTASHDIEARGVLEGIAIEAKHTKTLQVPKWATHATTLYADQWMLITKPGDARTTNYGSLAVLPFGTLLDLLHIAQCAGTPPGIGTDAQKQREGS